MALADRELCSINPGPKPGKYTVTVYDDSGAKQATFDCGSERDAVALRDAIRMHADNLRHVANFAR